MAIRLTGPLVAAMVCVFGFTWSLQAQAQALDCGAGVTLSGGQVNIEESGNDDTARIQCALDEAKDRNLAVVKLKPGIFTIGAIEIADFFGSLEGNSIATTTLIIDDNSIDCQLQADTKRIPTALKFQRGNVRVARMTIGVGSPCQEVNTDAFIVVHFTGSPAGDTCSNETGFGVIDRVELVGADMLVEQIIGVASVAEGALFGDCNETLLGTLKVNRSSLSNFYFAVLTSLRGAGQVDINFNEFAGNLADIYSADANQLLTVQSNDFFKFNDFNFEHVSVFSANGSSGPSQHRIVVYNNDFDLNEGSSLDLAAVQIEAFEGVAVSASVSNNDFLFDSPVGIGINIEGLDGSNIVSNNFSGEAGSGIIVDDGGIGTTVVSNDMFGFFAGDDEILLGDDSNLVIAANNPFAFINNQGVLNVVIYPVSPLKTSQTISTQASRAAHRADAEQRFEAAQQRVAHLLGRDSAQSASGQSRFAAPGSAFKLSQLGTLPQINRVR